MRNGEWGQASIPVSDLRGTAIDLRMLSYPFVILEEQGIGCEFAVDDIYWDGGRGHRRRRSRDRSPGRLAAAERRRTRSTPARELRFELPASAPMRSRSMTSPGSG